MTATLTAVRQGLAAVLDTIDGLNCYAFAPASLITPAAVVKPAPGPFFTYKATLDRADLELVIGLFVQGTTDDAATEELDVYLADAGAQSIYAVVLANHTLGGIVDDASVMAAQNHGQYTYTDINCYGVEFPVAVML